MVSVRRFLLGALVGLSTSAEDAGLLAEAVCPAASEKRKLQAGLTGGAPQG